MNKPIEEDITVPKINRKFLYRETKASAKKRLEWWNKTSAESISNIIKEYSTKAVKDENLDNN